MGVFHMRKVVLAVALAGAAFAVVPAQAAVELITNGGFETGTFSGWTITGSGSSGVASNSGTGVPALMQNYRAFFNGATVNLYQDIATTIGQTYTFGFTQEMDGSSTVDTFTASFGGNTVLSLSNTAGNGIFNVRSYSVTATSALTRVAFSFAGNNFQNFDNVTLQASGAAPVPEPATWAMMIGGFGLVGGALRRHRRSDRSAALSSI